MKSLKLSEAERSEINLRISKGAVLDWVKQEMKAARKKHKKFQSWHEAHSVILEEFEEFWDSVKEDEPHIDELISVAAMSILAIAELTGRTDQYGKRI